MMPSLSTLTIAALLLASSQAFVPHAVRHSTRSWQQAMTNEDDATADFANNNDNDNNKKNNEAERMKKQAEELREQIRNMEAQLGDNRRSYNDDSTEPVPEITGLRGKRVLVAGANGRLGSMVCRYLLRQHPETEVVAAVHRISEDSYTSRGYARLSYEVGAEDGVGQIGAAWSAEDRVATFEYNPDVMAGYNLQNLRLVECELLDPVQCQTVTEGVDAVVWCATDFNGNAPRAVASLDFAFLFRAVAAPTKGRVEVEGLQNMLGALKLAKQQKQFNSNNSDEQGYIDFVHVSMAPGTYMDFETPFGSFWSIKSIGDAMVHQDFPSLASTVLQFGAFDDNFVEEGLEAQQQDVSDNPQYAEAEYLRRINRRDAAQAAVDALLDTQLAGKTVQVWTDERLSQ